jgi:hypothetical protein
MQNALPGDAYLETSFTTTASAKEVHTDTSFTNTTLRENPFMGSLGLGVSTLENGGIALGSEPLIIERM